MKTHYLTSLAFAAVMVAVLFAFGPITLWTVSALLLSLAGLGWVAWNLQKIFAGMHKAQLTLDAFAKGNLTQRMVGRANGNELEALGWSVNKMAISMSEVLGSLRNANKVLNKSVTSFQQSYGEVELEAKGIRDNSETVAAAAEQSSAGIGMVGNSADSVNQAVMAVSAAMEEMVATASEIERRCSEENKVALVSQQEAKAAEGAMEELQGLVSKIGAITTLIEEIASQTNLLALNATIEAAGAGEAGKGFTVVASEVKQLSRQTASATGEIRSQVERIQKVAQAVSERIVGVSRVAHEVELSAQGTLHAVQEQRSAVQEVSGSLANAGASTTQIAKGMQEVSAGAKETAFGVAKIFQAAGKTSAHLGENAELVKSIHDTSLKLSSMIDYFQVAVVFAELTPDLLTRVGLIDSQHRRLFDLVNELNRGVVEGISHEKMLQIFDSLLAYAGKHFQDEEDYMRKAKYSEYDAHVKVHESFVAKVQTTRADFAAGRGMVASEIIRFLTDWLVNHIGRTDLRYAPAMKKAGL